MMSGLNCRPSLCYAELVTVTPQHLSITASSSKFISNVGLTRNKVFDLSFNQVKRTSFCQTLASMLSRLELETFCVESRRDNHYTTDLKISPLSSNFLSNVRLTRNKKLDLNFNQVKKTSFCQKTCLDAVQAWPGALCMLRRSANRYTTAPCD